MAQASQGHWRQEPWDRVWEGLSGAELLCEDPWGPQARVFPESCRVFLRVMITGRGPGGWTESALPLPSPSSDHPSLYTVSAGPGFLESISDPLELSPQCVPCTECSNPKTGHNAEGDGGATQVSQSCECEQNSPRPIAQLVKNPPAMQETPVQFLDQKNLLEKG